MTEEAERVVAFPGHYVPTPANEPVAEVVSLLEEFLQKAKDGAIVGIGLVAVERQPMANLQCYHVEQGGRHSLMAGVMGLAWKLGEIAATP